MLKYFPSDMLKKNILSSNLFYNYQFFKGVSVSKFGFDSCIGFQDRDLFCENKDMFLFCNLIPALTWTNMFELKPETQFVFFNTSNTYKFFNAYTLKKNAVFLPYKLHSWFVYMFDPVHTSYWSLFSNRGGVLHSIEICIFVFSSHPTMALAARS